MGVSCSRTGFHRLSLLRADLQRCLDAAFRNQLNISVSMDDKLIVARGIKEKHNNKMCAVQKSQTRMDDGLNSETGKFEKKSSFWLNHQNCQKRGGTVK